MLSQGVGSQITHGILKLLFIALLAQSQSVIAGCLESANQVNSVVSITRYFTDEDGGSHPQGVGIRGTAWFISPKSMVTAAHVSEAMGLSETTWKTVEIGNAQFQRSLQVRVRRLFGEHAEKLAILEIAEPFPGIEALRVRTAALAPGETVVSVGFPGNRQRLATGRFVNYGDAGALSGMALFELSDGNDRLVLDHGASGAPVFDCEGRVVAIVSNIFAKTITFLSQTVRISTAWGSPNIAALPATALGRGDDLN